MRASGIVQGVGFRAYVARSAHKHGLEAEAINEPDGTVLIKAEGERQKLDEFISFLRNTNIRLGPQVKKLIIEKIK